jgi:hypothetical protein
MPEQLHETLTDIIRRTADRSASSTEADRTA